MQIASPLILTSEFKLLLAYSCPHLTFFGRSGYVNYPAGGLCYRDERMKYLITWTSPIVYHAGDEEGSMGVYGVEGSKPGAAAVATWLTHRMLKLHPEGYGRLLGEAVFTCTKVCL